MKKYNVLFEATLIFILVGLFQLGSSHLGIHLLGYDYSLFWINVYDICINILSSAIAIFTAFWLWKLRFKWNFYVPSSKICGIAALIVTLEFLSADIINFIPFLRRLSIGKILFYELEFSQIILLHSQNWFFLVYAILIGPLIEEFFFRGILFEKFKTILPLWSSIVFSSFFFALVHLSLESFLYYFIGGCLLAYIYHRTTSLVLVIGYHMVFNMLSLLVPRQEFNTNDNQFLLILLFFFACCSGLYMALKHFHAITSPVEENSSPLDPLEYE